MEYTLVQSTRYLRWFKKLPDNQQKDVANRLKALRYGVFGDHHQTSGKLWELRFMSGHSAGIRIYYAIRNNELILIAAGGNKSSQKKDIEAAKEILKNWR